MNGDACIQQCCVDHGCTDDKPSCVLYQQVALCVEASCSLECVASPTCELVSCSVD